MSVTSALDSARAPAFDDSDLKVVDARFPAPLYHQLYALIRRKIEAGELRFGVALPSELALVKLFGISRITCKRALDELELEGFVARSRGRGTHVRYHYEPQVLLAPLTSMLESLTVMGQETEVQLLSLERVTVPRALQSTLRLEAGALVQRAVRVRSAQGNAFAFYVSHTRLLAGMERVFTAKALKTQTRLDLFRALGVQITEVDQLLSAAAASADVAAALGMVRGAPLLSVVRTHTDQHGQIIDHLHGLYRPDRFQYHMHMTAHTKKRAGRL